ncbi:acyl-CoA dehydrogenase [Paenibacillus hemerocallicola]|uniref:Acyl-CoA dehydrogenase n=1 Tax=Paenibacillus hemerocallicola TaxID=1172614 RepID=A0A5C4T5M3_9BACL|nr:acyl-CoA dehydrogenase [Paenibacillus hemerocallicola]
MSTIPVTSDELSYSLNGKINDLQKAFSDKAGYYDQSGLFPHENIDLVTNNALHTVTIDSDYGGMELGFEETSELLVRLASGCPSTALCLAMHYYTIAGLNKVLSPQQKSKIYSDIRNNGHYFTSFNQPNVTIVQANQDFTQSTGIAIKKVDEGYLVNGVKRCSSGIDRFSYIPIYGNQVGIDKSRFGISALFLRRDDPGVTITSSWDNASLRASAGHDVLLNDVFVSKDRLIGHEGFGVENTSNLVFWSRMAISSVYLGIAKASMDYITTIIKHKKDYVSKKTLAFLPNIQYAFSELKIKYDTAHSQLKMFVKQADYETFNGKYTDDLFQRALVTKFFVGRTANEIVWQAMQIEGMRSMSRGSVLERLYRDVRAATFHQPNDDLMKEILAKKALGLIAPKNRWV